MFSADSAGYDDDISDDEIDRRLAVAGLIPPTAAASPTASAAPAATPPTAAVPSTAPAAPVVQPTASPQPVATSVAASPAVSGDDAASIKALLNGGTDDTSPAATPTASAAASGADPTDTTAADNAAAQAQRNQAATNRYLKSQGAAMTVTPTGQEAQATDGQGVGLYKKAVVEPFWRDPADNEAYRISRNEYGNFQSDRIADGVQGDDWKLDPSTGEKYVDVSGADGGSKRQVIGQDHTVPAANAMKAAQQGHQADAEAAGQAADEAEQGTAGASGLGSYALADLKQYHQGLTKQVNDAQSVVDQSSAYMRGGRTLNGPQLDALRTAQNTLDQAAPQVGALQDEIGGRESAITQARQQRTASTAAMRDAAGFRNILSTDSGQTQVKATLGTVLASGALDPGQVNRYTAAGLVQQDDSGKYSLTDRGMGLLSDGRTPKQPSVSASFDPGATNTAPAASGQSAAGQMLRMETRTVRHNPDGSETVVAINGQPPQPDGTPAVPMQNAGLARPETTATGQAAPPTMLRMTQGRQRVNPDGSTTPVGDDGQPLTAPDDDPSQPLPVRIGRIRQNTLDQQRTILSEFPSVGQPGSAMNLKFIRAFQATGSDPRKALQVARVVFGGG